MLVVCGIANIVNNIIYINNSFNKHLFLQLLLLILIFIWWIPLSIFIPDFFRTFYSMYSHKENCLGYKYALIFKIHCKFALQKGSIIQPSHPMCVNIPIYLVLIDLEKWTLARKPSFRKAQCKIASYYCDRG